MNFNGQCSASTDSKAATAFYSTQLGGCGTQASKRSKNTSTDKNIYVAVGEEWGEATWARLNRVFLRHCFSSDLATQRRQRDCGCPVVVSRGLGNRVFHVGFLDVLASMNLTRVLKTRRACHLRPQLSNPGSTVPFLSFVTTVQACFRIAEGYSICTMASSLRERVFLT